MNILEKLLGDVDATYDQKCVPLLLLSGQELEARLGRISAHFGLTSLQTLILHYLEEGDFQSMTINELSECLSQKANTSRSVGQLVKMDLVTKERCTDDERVVYVKITEKGISLKKSTEIALQSMYTLGLDEKDGKVLYDLLLKVMMFQGNREL